MFLGKHRSRHKKLILPRHGKKITPNFSTSLKLILPGYCSGRSRPIRPDTLELNTSVWSKLLVSKHTMIRLVTL